MKKWEFGHADMHHIADWPWLERLVSGRSQQPTHLDSRSVAGLYASATKDDWAAMSAEERAFAGAALQAHPPRPPILERYEELTGAPDQQAHTLDDMPAEIKALMISALEASAERGGEPET